MNFKGDLSAIKSVQSINNDSDGLRWGSRFLHAPRFWVIQMLLVLGTQCEQKSAQLPWPE